MNYIRLVSKHHKDYIQIIKNFGEYFYAEDLVQEMYIKLIDKNREKQVIINGEVNRYYIYLMLRSIFIDFYRQKNKVIKVSLNEVLTLSEIDSIEDKYAFEMLCNKVNTEMDNWHHYDKLLFELYKNTDKSMRDIAKDTTISLRSIFRTLKHCKERIKENISEDYEDYVNGDYELIK